MPEGKKRDNQYHISSVVVNGTNDRPRARKKKETITV